MQPPNMNDLTELDWKNPYTVICQDDDETWMLVNRVTGKETQIDGCDSEDEALDLAKWMNVIYSDLVEWCESNNFIKG